MKHREYVKAGAGVIASVSLAPGVAFATRAAPAKPNLLIIHTDEHNFRTLGCYRETLSPNQACMWGKGKTT